MIENHVTSIEVSKKLKELRIHQGCINSDSDKENFIYWIYNQTTKKYYLHPFKEARTGHMAIARAFLASELLEMIPERINYQPDKFLRPLILVIEKMDEYKKVSYHNFPDYETSQEVLEIHNESFAEACAEMLLWLIELEVITIHEINSKLLKQD